MFENVGIG